MGRRLKTNAILTKNLSVKFEVSDQHQRPQKRKAKYLTKYILSSNTRFKNESKSFEEQQVDGETCMELNLCDSKISSKETQTEVDYENSNQLKIIELEKKLLLLEKRHKITLKQLQDANSLNASISKIFTKEQLERLRNLNKKWNWTAEDIYSAISSHLSLLLSHQQLYPQNLHQSSPLQSINEDLPTNNNSCSNGRASNTNKLKLKCDQCNMIFNSRSTYTSHVKSHKKQQQHNQQLQHPPQAIGSTYRRDPHTQRPRIANPETDLVPLQKLQQQQQQQQTDLVPLQQQQQQLQQHDSGFSSNIKTRNHSNRNAVIPTSPSRSSSPSLSTAIAQVSSTGGDADLYQCNVCQKTFILRDNLNQHYRLHTGELPFECEFCHKKFSCKQNLQVHRRIHTKERPYKCDECGKLFAQSNNLNRHKKIHTGERPHKCSFCEKTFTQPGNLVIHVRTHTGEKPFKCEFCDKIFSTKGSLQVHRPLHTKDRPYKCAECGKAFENKSKLKRHMKNHTDERL